MATNGDVNEWATTCGGGNNVGNNIAAYFLKIQRDANIYVTSGTFGPFT